MARVVVRADQIIDHAHGIAAVEQMNIHMAADEAGSAVGDVATPARSCCLEHLPVAEH